MIAVVILALLMVPVFFVSVLRVLAGDREKVEEGAMASAPHTPDRRHPRRWMTQYSRVVAIESERPRRTG